MKKTRAVNICDTNAINICAACILTALTAFAGVGAACGAFARVDITAVANSGPSSWQGVTATGVLFTGESCPIEVEGELLTLDIPDFIGHGSTREDMLAYDGKFAAEYTFKNPTADTVNATLAFPLGGQCPLSFWDEEADEQVYLDEVNADKYKVLADGEELNAQLRHTICGYGEFDFAKGCKQLVNGYRAHGFFKRDTPVYKYSFTIASYDNEYFTAEAVLKNTEGLRLCGRGRLEEDGRDKTVDLSVKNGSLVEIYSIGGELNVSDIKWSFYRQTGPLGLVYNSVDARAEYRAEDFGQTTFEEYVFNGYTGGNGVSATDYYNGVLDFIDSRYKDDLLPPSFEFLDERTDFMRWLVYDLSFSAGQTVKNTVTAPLYSGGKYYYTPIVYTFEYLLSPAREWSSFKSLEIRINTPYYLINSSLDFEKTDYGYLYKADRLPDGELEIDMCTVENPEQKANYIGAILIGIMVMAGLLCIAPVIVVVGLIILLLIRAKKRNPNADKGGTNGFKPMNNFD